MFESLNAIRNCPRFPGIGKDELPLFTKPAKIPTVGKYTG
jgi:hypothetical protein